MKKAPKISKGYRFPREDVAEAQRLAKESKGALKESDVVRIALKNGLRHVAEVVLPAITRQKP